MPFKETCRMEERVGMLAEYDSGHWSVSELCRRRGVSPPYSPDLNPIEQAFAKMKTLLRKADARTIDDTWRQIGALLDRFTAAECANYFTNARICFSLTKSRSRAGC